MTSQPDLRNRAGGALRVSQRASAIYDLVAMTPFALPGVAAWEIGQLRHTAEAFSIPGALPVFAPTHLFFANVFGIFTIVWSIVRLRRTEPAYGAYDAILRFAFASTMFVYVLGYGVTQILLFFAALEVFWGTVQSIAYARWRSVHEEAPPGMGAMDESHVGP